jgi:hypothetical protein
MRRRQLRTWAKWALTIAALFVATLWIGSEWRYFGIAQYVYSTRSGTKEILPWRGLGVLDGSVCTAKFQHGVSDAEGVETFYFFERAGDDGDSLMFTAMTFLVVRRDCVPLWPFLLVVGVPSAVMWTHTVLAWRRSRIGCCRSCGYDRAGLAADAKCPECSAVPKVG